MDQITSGILRGTPRVKPLFDIQHAAGVCPHFFFYCWKCCSAASLIRVCFREIPRVVRWPCCSTGMSFRFFVVVLGKIANNYMNSYNSSRSFLAMGFKLSRWFCDFGFDGVLNHCRIRFIGGSRDYAISSIDRISATRFGIKV